MAKKRKSTLEDDDFFKKIQYHMEHTPGFASLIKFSFFALFCLILLIVARVTINSDLKIREEYEQVTTNVQNQRSAYKTLVDDLKGKKAKITIQVDDKTYMIDNMVTTDGVATGLFENENGTKKFKIESGKIYEYKLGKEVENNDLFEGLERTLIVPSELISLLETNKTIKQVTDKNVTYSYELVLNDMTYNTIVTIVDDAIVSISIKKDTIKYIYSYTS